MARIRAGQTGLSCGTDNEHWSLPVEYPVLELYDRAGQSLHLADVLAALQIMANLVTRYGDLYGELDVLQP